MKILPAILTTLVLLMVSGFKDAKGYHPYQTEKPDSSDLFINGWEYRMIPARNGHPYVSSKIWQYGKINSDLGIRESFLMNYDIYQDALVIQTFIHGNPAQVILNPANIRSFYIEDQHFINPAKFPEFYQHKLEGYYELIYDGGVKLLVKWNKFITDESNINGRSYELRTNRYLLHNDNFYEIRNNRSIYKIFPEHKKEISRYMRNNQVMLRDGDNTRMEGLVKFIDNLLNN